MKQTDPSRINDINTFLVAPAVAMPASVDGTVIFGRKSRHLVETAADAVMRSNFAVISGEVGKDSGDNPMHGISEDDWLIDELGYKGVDTSCIYTDPFHPKNGIDNANGMVAVIHDTLGFERVWTLAAITHTTQARRLGATLLQRINASTLKVDNLVVVASSYPFNPEDPFDQYEAAFEITRLDELSQGPNAAFPRPEGLDPFVCYARETKALLDQRFADEGILNWSTADNTDRTIHPEALPGIFEATHQ